MGFMDAIKSCFKQYAGFSGRAARSEYWFYTLFLIVANVVFTILQIVESGALGTPIFTLVSTLFSLAVILPSIAVTVRRLHDLDKVGWWALVLLIPLIGPIGLMLYFIKKGTDGENRFGADPLGGVGVPTVEEA